MRFLVLSLVFFVAALSARASEGPQETSSTFPPPKGVSQLGNDPSLTREPFTNFNVVLLQPSAVLEERVASIDAMADYIKAIEAAARDAVATSQARQSTGGYLVVAVRPGEQSKVWLDFDTLLDLEIRKQLVAKAEAVKPFEARKGPVVFALKVALWGGKETRRPAPLPPEWKKAQQGGVPLEVGALAEAVWDDQPQPVPAR